MKIYLFYMKLKFVIFYVIQVIFGSHAEANRLNVWHVNNINLIDRYKLMIAKCKRKAELLLNKKIIWEPNLEERLICKYNKIQYQKEEKELVRDAMKLDLNRSTAETNTNYKDPIETIVDVYSDLLLNTTESNPYFTMFKIKILMILYFSGNATTECFRRHLSSSFKKDKVKLLLQKLKPESLCGINFIKKIKYFIKEIRTEKDLVLSLLEVYRKSLLFYDFRNRYKHLSSEINQAKHHFIDINIKDISSRKKIIGYLDKIEKSIDKEDSRLHLVSINLDPHYLANEYEHDSNIENKTTKLHFFLIYRRRETVL